MDRGRSQIGWMFAEVPYSPADTKGDQGTSASWIIIHGIGLQMVNFRILGISNSTGLLFRVQQIIASQQSFRHPCLGLQVRFVF